MRLYVENLGSPLCLTQKTLSNYELLWKILLKFGNSIQVLWMKHIKWFPACAVLPFAHVLCLGRRWSLECWSVININPPVWWWFRACWPGQELAFLREGVGPPEREGGGEKLCRAPSWPCAFVLWLIRLNLESCFLFTDLGERKAIKMGWKTRRRKGRGGRVWGSRAGQRWGGLCCLPRLLVREKEKLEVIDQMKGSAS